MSKEPSDDPRRRISVRLRESKIEEIEELIDEGEYANRSEAVRDGVEAVLSHFGKRDPGPYHLPHRRPVQGGAGD